jgi:hypothetical protein
MERQRRRYKVKSYIMGGGLALHEGQVVDEVQLDGYTDWLMREGGIEEMAEGHAGLKNRRKPHAD